MEKFSHQYILLKNNHDSHLDHTWSIIEFKDYTLYTSPNLKVFQFENNDSKLVLLGFCFHVLKPDLDEEEILLSAPADKTAFLDYLDALCGNYLLMKETHGVLELYHDPAGVFKMFSYAPNNVCLAVGPDPAIIHEHFPLQKSKKAESIAFYQSEFFKKNLVRLGKHAIYEDVQQVIPNHSLLVNANTINRYFPRAKKEAIDLETAIEKVHTYTSNCMDAAYRKYQIRCTLTGGWDSRMVLAFTKKHRHNTEYFTVTKPPFKHSHYDIQIPQKICKKLGLTYKIYEREVLLTEEEQQNAMDSFTWLNQSNLFNILGPFSRFKSPDQLILIGSVSEICKNYYDSVNISDGKSLSQAAHFPVMTYTVDHFQKVYDEMKHIQDQFDYDLADLIHWEQDITNFAGAGIMLRSFTTKTFSPFNCRLVIKTVLSIPRKYRDKQRHTFYKAYIAAQFPELNEFEVNPNLKKELIVLSKKMGIYNIYKKISTRFR